MVDVSFHLDGRTYEFSQPFPHSVCRPHFATPSTMLAQLADLERVQVTLQSGATPCSIHAAGDAGAADSAAGAPAG